MIPDEIEPSLSVRFMGINEKAIMSYLVTKYFSAAVLVPDALGLYPVPITLHGKQVATWRGVPVLPCDKLPISDTRTTAILAMRLGEKDQGVVGLHQAGIPDEVEPSLSVRRMDIGDRAIASYLVSAYFSAAVLIPDALGILEDVQIG